MCVGCACRIRLYQRRDQECLQAQLTLPPTLVSHQLCVSVGACVAEGLALAQHPSYSGCGATGGSYLSPASAAGSGASMAATMQPSAVQRQQYQQKARYVVPPPQHCTQASRPTPRGASTAAKANSSTAGLPAHQVQQQPASPTHAAHRPPQGFSGTGMTGQAPASSRAPPTQQPPASARAHTTTRQPSNPYLQVSAVAASAASIPMKACCKPHLCCHGLKIAICIYACVPCGFNC